MMSTKKRIADYLTPEELDTLEKIRERTQSNSEVISAIRQGKVIINISDLNKQIESDRRKVNELKEKAYYRKKVENELTQTLQELDDSAISQIKSRIRVVSSENDS